MIEDTAANVLHARIRWTIACARQLLEVAREEGWTVDNGIAAPTIELAAAQCDLETASLRVGEVPFDRLRIAFSLAPVEMDALWLLACCEIEPRIGRLLQLVEGSTHASTIATLERLVRIAGGELEASCMRNLAENALVETVTDPARPVHQRAIRAADRVLALARGHMHLDPELARIASIIEPDELGARRVDVPAALSQGFARGAVVVARGVTGSGRTALLSGLCARQGKRAVRIVASEVSTEGNTRRRQLRAVARECRLLDLVPLVVDDVGSVELDNAIDRELVERIEGPVLVARSQPRVFVRATVEHEMTLPTVIERRATWQAALPRCAPETLDAVAQSYAIQPGTIAAAAEGALARMCGSEPSEADVHASLRAHLDGQVASVAHRVHVTQTWEDLVLPSDQFDQLVELVARVRCRQHVLEEWGFAEKVGRGTGVAALLSGPPGTGKTMAAGLIANELGLDLYQIDLSRIVSKYIGETEKNLGRVFDLAESGHVILLFDEADSLFAKRSEVKSSNDRYANQEVNYLLQRMEQFRGITLLTTNHESSLDEAFRRRISMHVRFSAPDEALRELLWRAMLPERAAVAPDVDHARLAREFEMAGGYIKNAALRAAYLAANDGTAMTMDHFVRAARAECEGIGRIIVEHETAARRLHAL